MNDLLYNKKTAYIAVFLMILVSIFILGGNDLRREHTRVMDIALGYNELGIDVTHESAIVLANSSNLLVVARRYMDSGDRRIADISNILDNTLWGLNDSAGYRPLDIILPYVQRLIDDLSTMNIEPRSGEQLTEIEINIYAALRRIRLSGYNGAATEFNRLLRNPYTGMIATVRGIDRFSIIGE